MVNRRIKLILWWRRSGMALRLLVFVLGSLLLGLLVYLQRPQDDSAYDGGNLQIFLLVNFLIVVLCILAFLVGRNVVKLVFDRRRKILGSRLRLRLVGAFLFLTAVPTSILFVLSSGLVTNAFEGWFNSQIESSITSSIEIAKQHYSFIEGYALRESKEIAGEIATQGKSSPAQLHKYLESRRTAGDFFSLKVISLSPSDEVETISEASNATAGLDDFKEPEGSAEIIKGAVNGSQVVREEGIEASRFFRAYVPIGKNTGQALIATLRIAPEVTHAQSIILDWYKENEQLKLFRNQLRSGNILTLLMITMLLLFAALWLGFYLARELTVPIQRLAEGTQAVARGNLDFVIRGAADDELGLLVRSFNQMTSDLRGSRAEIEQRRLYTEAILRQLAVAVVGLDRNDRIHSINSPAIQLLGLSAPEYVVGKTLDEVVAGDFLPLLEQLKSEAIARGEVIEQELNISSQGRELKVVATAGTIEGDLGGGLGTVLIFDDVTELAKAQHMSAWREVARRIAHEIKNPLTPIQLSAQRLERLVKDPQSAPVVRECTEAIVENVNSIKRLANEFTNFARMPTVEFRMANPNSIIADALAPYAESNSNIVFQFIADGKIPEIQMDPEQIRRTVINLLENAIKALRDDVARDPAENARVTVKTSFDSVRRRVAIEVSDNGPGIPPGDRIRIFEPYFSTSKEGTGLGLAIVTSIVADHQGVIRVYDNLPRGARFVINLPIEQKPVTQRRLASGVT